jgi:transglutaminase-like putative cysteine protease
MFDRSRSRTWFRFADWQRVLYVLFSGLFLLQFILWIGKEDQMWWPETLLNAKWTLFTTGIVLVIPRIHWALRGLLLFVVWFGVNAKLSHYHFISLKIRSLSALGNWFVLNFSQLQPFIWFSFGTGLAYLFAMWWNRTKPRIFALIIVSVLFFAIRDSFSTLILWPQVAIVLFCGLSLLVLRHFSELKRRAPKSWEHLSEYPASVVLPVAAIMAAIIALGVFMPTARPLITDPYTAWKHAKGEPVLISGKGEISDWVPPARDASSGYGRNDRELGNGFQFDYTPVFEVQASRRSYWRGETRSLYTGNGWEMSDTEKRAAVTSARAGTALRQDSRFNTSQLKTEELTQTVKVLTDDTYPVLFGAMSIDKVQEVGGGTDTSLLQWAPNQSELRYKGEKTYPKEYTLVSKVPVIDEKALRSLTQDSFNKNEFADYLQLPEKLPQRVKTLASEITKDAPTPYDKVKKIESFLSTNYTYTNTPDLSKGKSKDFVDRFLFEIKEGYCDYYSTAMVVLTRSIGLPARWVKGYSSGSSPLQEQIDEGLMRGMIPNPNAGGTYTVRNSDAHSWVEVYFNGFGWIPFEPTAGFTMPVVHPEDAPAVQPDTETTPAAVPPAQDETKGHPFVWIFAGAAVIAAAAIALLLNFRFGWFTGLKKRRRSKQAVDFSQRIVLEFDRLLRYFRRKGYQRQEHETIREAVRRWMQQSRWLTKDLDVLLQLFEKAKYGKAAVSEEDWQLAEKTMQKLRTELK